MTAGCTHVRFLMRKNFLLKRRQWISMSFKCLPLSAIFEFLLPFSIALLWSLTSRLSTIDVRYTGWNTQDYTTLDFHASTDCVTNCTPYSERLGSPAPFINTMIKLHWTQSMDVPVKIAFAPASPELLPHVRTIRKNINDMWYSPLEMKNIPCDYSSVFYNFGIPIDETNLNKTLLTRICGKAQNVSGEPRRPGRLSGFNDVSMVYDSSAALDAYLTGKS